MRMIISIKLFAFSPNIAIVKDNHVNCGIKNVLSLLMIRERENHKNVIENLNIIERKKGECRKMRVTIFGEFVKTLSTILWNNQFLFFNIPSYVHK